MSIPKWLMERPDFSDRDEYEEAGWVKVGKFDLPIRDGEIMDPCSVGTINPLEKLATITKYENEILGLIAEEIDFLDQGVVYTEWYARNSKKGDPVGLALKISDNRWYVKNLNEMFDIRGDFTTIRGKRVPHKITLVIFKITHGRRDEIWKLDIAREDD